MKKLLLSFLFISFMLSVFALSYDDNEFQRKSRAYAELSKKALEEGDYDASIKYSLLSEENARLSVEFIQKMLARIEAEQAMNKARTRYQWAKTNNAESRYPDLFAEATEALNAGGVAFEDRSYDVATSCAIRVLKALEGVQGDESMFSQLPETYEVRTWRGERDCLWNIAELPGVFGNALEWEKLYEANKDIFPNLRNPDFITPGMILKIPSIKGEKRVGRYDHNANYKRLE